MRTTRSHGIASWALASALLFILPACGGEEQLANEPQEDGVNDSFLASGKADTGGISEGSAEAKAVLKVVNTATRSALVNDAELTSRAADNLIAYRVGDDEEEGTADDETFDTLKELDAVPYIGVVAFQKLVDYARTLGYLASDLCAHVTCSVSAPRCEGDTLIEVTAATCNKSTGRCDQMTRKTSCPNGCQKGACVGSPSSDPYSEASCQGPAITKAELLKYFPPAAKSAGGVGTYKVYSRKRDCNKQTGCKPWLDHEGIWYEDTATVGYTTAMVGGTIMLDIVDDWSRNSGSYFFGPYDPDFPFFFTFEAPSAAGSFRCGLGANPTLTCYLGGLLYIAGRGDSTENHFTGVSTNHCVRFSFKYSSQTSSSQFYTEYESVILGTLN